MERFKRVCLDCGAFFETVSPIRYFCSSECLHRHERNDPIFKKDAERIIFNKEHETHYSYGDYIALKNNKSLDSIANEGSKNVHTPYWVSVPEKVVI